MRWSSAQWRKTRSRRRGWRLACCLWSTKATRLANCSTRAAATRRATRATCARRRWTISAATPATTCCARGRRRLARRSRQLSSLRTTGATHVLFRACNSSRADFDTRTRQAAIGPLCRRSPSGVSRGLQRQPTSTSTCIYSASTLWFKPCLATCARAPRVRELSSRT